MGRIQKTKPAKHTEEKHKEGEEKAERKKRRYRPGGVRTRQKINRAQKKQPIPVAVMRRLIAEASEGKVKWSKAALKLLLEVIHADVHKTLVITKAAMAHANKKILKKTHLEFGAAIVSEIGGGLTL